MEDHALAGDPRGERRRELAGGDQVHVAREERLRVGIQRGALAQAEAATGGWLHEEVEVRIRSEVGPGGGAERDEATQPVAMGEGMHAPVAGGRDAVMEAPQGRSAVIAMSRPVRERAVDRPGEHAHPQGAVAGRPVVEQALAQSGLVEELDQEIRVEGAQVDECGLEERLVGGLGEATDHEDGALLVGPGELGGAVGAGNCGEGLDRFEHREREAHDGGGAGIRGECEPAVAVLDELVVREHTKRAVGAGCSDLEDRGDLDGAQALGPLREGDERTQAMLGRYETAHERILTLTA
jgi:hypothetical protein